MCTLFPDRHDIFSTTDLVNKSQTCARFPGRNRTSHVEALAPPRRQPVDVACSGHDNSSDSGNDLDSLCFSIMSAIDIGCTHLVATPMRADGIDRFEKHSVRVSQTTTARMNRREEIHARHALALLAAPDEE